MTIEFDDLGKEWDARAHTPDEYRQEIRTLRERCVAYVGQLGSVHAELTELRKQKEKGTLGLSASYRPWRSVHDYPPPFDTPVLVAVSLLGRDDFVFAAGVMYRRLNGAYADAVGNPISSAYRPEFWLSLNGLEGLRSHKKEVPL